MSVVSGRQGILLPAGFGFRCLASVSAHFGNRQQVPSHLVGGGAGEVLVPYLPSIWLLNNRFPFVPHHFRAVIPALVRRYLWLSAIRSVVLAADYTLRVRELNETI